jgi:protein gp37
LTKRADRLAELSANLPWPENLWIGVTVESAEYADRLDRLRSVPASVRFVSFEPLLGPIPDVDLSGIDWAIVGGESGPRARPMEVQWAREIRDRSLETGIPFFFKQIGGRDRDKGGRLLDGSEWNQFPIDL